jgi:voltage-gated potassium channel
MSAPSATSLGIRGDRKQLHQTIERLFDLPMLVMSVGFIVVIVWPLAQPGMAAHTRATLRAVDYGIWAAFALEYAALVATAPERVRYIVRHLPDLAMVALPMLRPLRFLRVLRLGVVAVSGAQRSRSHLLSRAPLYAAGVASLMVVCASVMELNAEQHAAGSNITDFGDATWWALTTITTVGYGDHYPVTGAGKAVAAVLMVSGIALLGIVTASVAAWFIHLTGESETEAEHSQISRLEAVIERLEAQVAELAAGSVAPDRPILS